MGEEITAGTQEKPGPPSNEGQGKTEIDKTTDLVLESKPNEFEAALLSRLRSDVERSDRFRSSYGTRAGMLMSGNVLVVGTALLLAEKSISQPAQGVSLGALLHLGGALGVSAFSMLALAFATFSVFDAVRAATRTDRNSRELARELRGPGGKGLREERLIEIACGWWQALWGPVPLSDNGKKADEKTADGNSGSKHSSEDDMRLFWHSTTTAELALDPVSFRARYSKVSANDFLTYGINELADVSILQVRRYACLSRATRNFLRAFLFLLAGLVLLIGAASYGAHSAGDHAGEFSRLVGAADGKVDATITSIDAFTENARVEYAGSPVRLPFRGEITPTQSLTVVTGTAIMRGNFLHGKGGKP